LKQITIDNFLIFILDKPFTNFPQAANRYTDNLHTTKCQNPQPQNKRRVAGHIVCVHYDVHHEQKMMTLRRVGIFFRNCRKIHKNSTLKSPTKSEERIIKHNKLSILLQFSKRVFICLVDFYFVVDCKYAMLRAT